MKNAKTVKWLLCLCCLLAALCAFSLAANAEIIRSGTCGDNLTWMLDDSGTLTISGKGAMTTIPWRGSFSSQIKTVVINDGVTSIMETAFAGCTGLTKVTIPDCVTSIGEYAFDSCKGLTKVTIPGRVTGIEKAAFAGCTGLTSVTIENGVTSIGNNVFAGCTGLTTVTIPGSVKSIGNEAFYCCAGLTTVTISDGVTSIGDGAFFGCTGLTKVTIPGSVTSIEKAAFAGCTGLTNLTVDADNPAYFSAGNCIIEKGSKTLVVGCKNSVLPGDGSVTSIGDLAFFCCTGLTTLTIPDCVTSIGTQVFLYCTGLMELTVDADNPVYFSAGNCIIEKGSKTLVVGCNNSVLPGDGSVTSIGEYAFFGCTELSSVRIPDSVNHIGNYAFRMCWGIKHLIIPETVKKMEVRAFQDCTGLIAVELHAETIGDDAFEDCTNLVSVSISDEVKTIGDDVFFGCASLKTIYVPSAVKEIGRTIVPKQTVLYGENGSYIQQWAADNGRVFIPIEKLSGDVDGDGKTSAADARLALRRSVNLERYPAGSSQCLACDADGDGKVTSTDARLILRASVGLEDASKFGKKA